jgi:probable HAF family extracellular repeat protein
LRSGQAVAKRSQAGERKPHLEALEDRRLLAASLTDLGTLGGYFSVAQGINNAGQVTGYAYTTNNIATHAFLYSDGTMTDLGTLPGGPYSYGQAINASGEVAGYAYTNILAANAFIDINGQMTDLGTFGGYNSAAYGINSAGQVVGYAQLPGNAVSHAFMYDGVHLNDLGTLGGSNSVATAINDAGQIAGYSDKGNGTADAFLYSGGVMTDLGTLGGPLSKAFGINASGLVVGASALSPGMHARHAFLFDGTTMTDLGTLGGDTSVAKAINTAGQIVGESTTIPGNANPDAFLYSGGQMIDLNSLLPPNSGWTLTSAYGINDNGQIAGVGAGPDGLTHAFLLTLDGGDSAGSSVSVRIAGLIPNASPHTVMWVDPAQGASIVSSSKSASPAATFEAPSVDRVFAGPAERLQVLSSAPAKHAGPLGQDDLQGDGSTLGQE